MWKKRPACGILFLSVPGSVIALKEAPNKPAIHIGLRNLKTALSASLCALIYYFLGRNPAFACIGAIFGMGANMDHSKLHGGNRLFGTIIGGFLGIALYRFYLIFYPDGDGHLLLVPLLFVGVVILIILAQIFWVGAVQPGGVVLCLLLFSIGPDNYISYSLNRMLDTGVGVVMSLFLNWLLPRERLDAWQAAFRARFSRQKN